MKKKIILAFITTLIISENIVADEYKVMSDGMSVGLQKIDMGGDADGILSYEFGIYKMMGNKIRYGWEWSGGFMNDDSSASSELIGDISGRLGYAPLFNLDIYGTLGYGVQTFGAITSAMGPVYGLAVHYGISDNMGIALSYKKYNLDYEYFDIDYDSSAMGLKLNFTF
jgi:hypothetical protein